MEISKELKERAKSLAFSAIIDGRVKTFTSKEDFDTIEKHDNMLIELHDKNMPREELLESFKNHYGKDFSKIAPKECPEDSPRIL